VNNDGFSELKTRQKLRKKDEEKKKKDEEKKKKEEEKKASGAPTASKGHEDLDPAAYTQNRKDWL
jgi:hypothetical protein